MKNVMMGIRITQMTARITARSLSAVMAVSLRLVKRSVMMET
jgi:hypothetical protein